MAWTAIYDATTGVLISVGTVVASNEVIAAKGHEALTLGFDPRTSAKQWNTTTREYDDVVPPKAAVRRQDFIERFTGDERDNLFDAARNDPNATLRKKIHGFIQYIQLSEHVHLDSGYIIASVNSMESAGIIGAGRAAEVLA